MSNEQDKYNSSPYGVVFYLTATLSFLGSFVTIVRILGWTGTRSLSSRLVLYLHVAQLVEVIFSIPFIYSQDSSDSSDTYTTTDVCSAVSVLRNFASLSSLVSCCLMYLLSYKIVFYVDDSRQRTQMIKQASKQQVISPSSDVEIAGSTSTRGSTNGNNQSDNTGATASIYSSSFSLIAKATKTFFILIFGEDAKDESSLSRFNLSPYHEFFFIFAIPFILSCIPLVHNKQLSIIVALNQTWCTFNETKAAFVYMLWTFYIPCWCIITLSLTVLAYFLYRLRTAQNMDQKVLKKLAKGIGAYAFVTFIIWLPRSIMRVVFASTNGTEVSATTYNKFLFWYFFLLFSAGLSYTIIFYFEQRSMARFESMLEEQAKVNRPPDGSTGSGGGSGGEAI